MGNLNGISELRILEGYGKEAGAKALPPRRDSCRDCVDRSLAWEDHSWTLAHSVLHIRECIIVLYLGMAKEISNLPYWCISRIMTKEFEAANPQSKHVDRLIPPSSSQIFTNTLWITRKLRKRSPKKLDFNIFFLSSSIIVKQEARQLILILILCQPTHMYGYKDSVL